MGNIINTIVSNDLLFYGLIVFLIVSVILFFVFLRNKKDVSELENETYNNNNNSEKSVNKEILIKSDNSSSISNNNALKMKLLEEEIEFTQTDSGKDINFSDSMKHAIVNNSDEEIVEKISELDGKLAIDKILNEDIDVYKNSNNNKDVVKTDDKPFIKKNDNLDNKQTISEEIVAQDDKAFIKKSVDIDDKPFIKKSPVKEDKIVKEDIEKANINKEIISNKNKKLENIQNEKSAKSELEIVLEKMQHDLEEQKDKDAVAMFEQEQEEKSIISYKELIERKNDLINKETLTDARFENEPDDKAVDQNLTDNFVNIIESINDNISIDMNEEQNISPSDSVSVKSSDSSGKKFVMTDFISPVFGRQKAEFDYPKVPNFKEMMLKREKNSEYDLETTLNLEPLQEQMKKDDAFLNALKEFRKNLE